MRLFAAILPDHHTKATLVHVQGLLPLTAPVQVQNLHLTAVFLGECSAQQAKCAALALKSLQIQAFPILCTGIGCFCQNNRKVVWAGIQTNDRLQQLHQDLCDRLLTYGLAPAEIGRRFIPHITLGRTNAMAELPLHLPQFSVQMPVDHVILMESRQSPGRTVYIPVVKQCFS